MRFSEFSEVTPAKLCSLIQAESSLSSSALQALAVVGCHGPCHLDVLFAGKTLPARCSNL